MCDALLPDERSTNGFTLFSDGVICSHWFLCALELKVAAVGLARLTDFCPPSLSLHCPPSLVDSLKIRYFPLHTPKSVNPSEVLPGHREKRSTNFCLKLLPFLSFQLPPVASFIHCPRASLPPNSL